MLRYATGAHIVAGLTPFGANLTNETIHSSTISLYKCQFGIHASRSRA
jgi:hypothetical protein